MKGMKPVAIRFDERKDITKVVDGVGENCHKRFTLKRVENCSVVVWPENGEKEKYVGHVVPNTGTGKGLATSLFQFLQMRETNLESLRVLLGDGTSKVNGWKGGTMAELEELLQRPCQRFICILHHAELPSRLFFRLLMVKLVVQKPSKVPLVKLL